MRTIKRNNGEYYTIKAGNFVFHIYSDYPAINSKHYNLFAKNPKYGTFDINIYLHKKNNTSLNSTILSVCVPQNEFIPSAIRLRNTILDSVGVAHVSLKQRINHFYKGKDYYCYCFKYETDQFNVLFNSNKDIHIIGDNINLDRTIKDFLCITAPTIPIHGAAVSDGENATLLIGESQSGKTSLTLLMIQKGYKYLCDDMIFFKGSRVFNCEKYTHIRKSNFTHNQLHYNYYKETENFVFIDVLACLDDESIEENYVNVSRVFRVNDKHFNESFLRPFPSVSRESIWVSRFFDFNWNLYRNSINNGLILFKTLCCRATHLPQETEMHERKNNVMHGGQDE